MTYAGDLTAQEAYELLREDPTAVLVDVRTRAEWSFVGVPDLAELGRAPVLLQWSDFATGAVDPGFVDQLIAAGVPAGAPVAFLCRSGQRSRAAAQAAAARGYGRAYNVSDGFEGPLDADGHRGGQSGWKASGLPWRQS